ncbi:MAG: hypothetical protein HYX72_00510 [Acidobacteria bacterium]|nr:hypothetical protein [Acidobacteriota bacterium]
MFKSLPDIFSSYRSYEGFACAALALLLLGCGQKPGTQQTASSSSEESLAYAPQISFSDLHLSAEENFLNQQLTYLDGQISNTGTRTVAQLKVRLSFRNLYNEVVLREEYEAIGAAQPLDAGKTRPFQIRFDQVPDSWNQAVPEMQIVLLRVQ